MKLTFTLFGIALGFTLGILFSTNAMDHVIESYAKNFEFLAAILLLLLAVILILYLFHGQIIRKLIGTSVDSADQLLRNIEEDLFNDSLSREQRLENRFRIARQSVGFYMAWTARAAAIRLMIAVVVGAAGAFGTYVLIVQNGLIRDQTTTLKEQTKTLKQQTATLDKQGYLLEAQTAQMAIQTQAINIQALLHESSVRTALRGPLDELLTDIRSEAEKQRNAITDAEEKPDFLPIPADLANRIVSLSRSLKPYHFLESRKPDHEINSELSDTMRLLYLSPERGILLRTLIEAGFKLDFGAIARPDFDYADLRNSVISADFEATTDNSCSSLDGKKLLQTYWLNLDYADLSGSQLYGVALKVSQNIVLDGTFLMSSLLSFAEGYQKTGKSSIVTRNTIIASTSEEVPFDIIDIGSTSQKCIIVPFLMKPDIFARNLIGTTIAFGNTGPQMRPPEVSDFLRFQDKDRAAELARQYDELLVLKKARQPPPADYIDRFLVYYEIAFR